MRSIHFTLPLAILSTLSLLLGCAAPSAPVTPIATPDPAIREWVQVTADGKGFELSPSGRRFVAWGFNYNLDEQQRQIEDYWDAEWSKIEEDFREMKALGATVVRIHLQFAKFMDDPMTPNTHAFDQLERMAALAEATGLYLDVTGLAAYRVQDTPEWYFALSEEDRWAAHARFWEAVAERLADSPAIFCYNLMNEPIAPAGQKKTEDLLDGVFGGFHFVQYLSLDQAGRPLDEIARQWIRTLTAAIRKHDQRHLITVGMLPPSPELGYFSGFVPEKISSELDFLSVHLYPEKDKISRAIEIVQEFSVGKPVVIEETSQLYCGIEQFEDFVLQSREFASGWLGFYNGQSLADLQPPKDVRQAINLQWLELFQSLTAEVTGEPTATPRP